MRESGIVVSSKNDLVTVQMVRGEKCNGCHACILAGPNLMQVEAQNDIGAHTGERVEIEVTPSQFLGHAVLIFIFPVIMMFVGYFIGRHIGFNMEKTGEGPGIIGSFAGLFLSFIIIKIYDTIWGQHNSCAAHVVGFSSTQTENSVLSD